MHRLRFLCIVLHVIVYGYALPLVGQDSDTPSVEKKADNETKDKEAKDERLPVPSKEAIEETTKLVQDVYKSEIKKASTPALKQALAKKLLADGIDTEDDPTGRFVLFRMARNLAANYGDVETAFEAIEQMSKSYKNDPLEEQAKVVIKVASKTTLPPNDRMDVVKLGLDLIDRAVAQNKYPLANRVAIAIIPVVRKTKDYKLLKLLTERKAEISGLAEKYDFVKKALSRLEREPTNTKANQTVGEYRCYIKGNWGKGLPMLALGTDPTLKKLAITDLKGASTAIEQVKLGNRWWQLAEKSKGITKTHIQWRAAHWYQKAIPSLTGLAKSVTQKRLAIAKTSGAKLAGKARGKLIDRIVIWNQHNGHYNNCGTELCNVYLLRKNKAVWGQKNVRVPWKRSRDMFVMLKVPSVAADQLRVEVTKIHSAAGGLAEVQVFSGKKNIALGAPVVTSAPHREGDPRSGDKITDGITTSAKENVGYWLTKYGTPTGWAVIDLSQAKKSASPKSLK